MRKSKKLFMFISFLCMLFAAVPVHAATPAINKTAVTIYVGKTYVLKIKNTKTKPTWHSKNTKIASVGSSTGKVTGKKAGKTVVYTTINKKKYSCTVTVKNVPKPTPTPTPAVKKEYPVRGQAPKAHKCVLRTFEKLKFKFYIDPKQAAAGHFDSKGHNITLNESDEAVAYHELGHFLAWMSGNRDMLSEFNDIYTSEKESFPGDNKIYASLSASEYFASSYSEYILHRNSLSSKCPQTYKYIQESVRILDAKTDEQIQKVYDFMIKHNIWKE